MDPMWSMDSKTIKTHGTYGQVHDDLSALNITRTNTRQTTSL